MANEEYKVAGYNQRSDYDAPYHPNADFDPALVFNKAGNPEAQEKWQNDLKELAGIEDEVEASDEPTPTIVPNTGTSLFNKD